jgi:hypothetical protein
LGGASVPTIVAIMAADLWALERLVSHESEI